MNQCVYHIKSLKLIFFKANTFLSWKKKNPITIEETRTKRYITRHTVEQIEIDYIKKLNNK